MRPADAIRALTELETEKLTGVESTYVEWRNKVAAVLRHTLGPTAPEVTSFLNASEVRREPYTLAHGPSRDLEAWRVDAVGRGKGVVRAAIFTLENTSTANPLDELSIDPELWEHVRVLVDGDDWGKIPPTVVIFVEDKIRRWAGEPKAKGGAAMNGQTLMATALGDAAELRLGAQSSEWQGWRSLATGLVQAVGNVDRHRIQQRVDGRRYALGVLGLGSLLLTQLRYQHCELICERDQGPVPTEPTV